MRHFFRPARSTTELNWITIFLLGLTIAFPGYTETFEKKYDNGLKLVVREDHRAPVVVSQLWYHVGSSYEHDGITGLSHALEHLMFQGTENTAAGEFSRIVSENGGRDNAFTGKHYTTYFQRIASDRLEICLRLEADRMTGLVIDEDVFKREMEVIKEERKLRVDSNPFRRFYERFIATVFIQSPLRHPVIGWAQDIEQLNMQQAINWYKRWYAPNNATLVVVGDVRFDEVDALVQRYFSPIKSRQIVDVISRREPSQDGMKMIQGYGDTSTPYLLMAYRSPVLNQPESVSDAYSLDVLSGILDGGASARFSQFLQREQEVAISASAGYNAVDRLDGLLTFTAIPKSGVSLDQLQSAIENQIERLKTEPVSEQELQRVKAQVVSGKVYERDSTFYMAMQIGTLETAGLDWRMLDDYADQIERVTAEDIQRVAKRYLVKGGLTLGRFEPESERP